jgi:uncharacterized protein (DUF1330 family)
MKTRYTIALSMLAGAALGIGALQGLHAQTKPMAYTIVENVISDQPGYMKVAPSLAKSTEAAGGKFLVRGGQAIAVHGTPPGSRVIVVQWPSLDKAQAWADSPDTQALFDEAKKYATLRDYQVEGVSQ